MQDFTATLHNMSMHYVVIIDPGIKVDRGYAAYDQGLKEDIFVKDVTGKPYLGQVSSSLPDAAFCAYYIYHQCTLAVEALRPVIISFNWK